MEKIYDIRKKRSYPLEKICINKELTKKYSKTKCPMLRESDNGRIIYGKILYACKGCVLSPKSRIYDDLPIYVTEKTYRNLKKEHYI